MSNQTERMIDDNIAGIIGTVISDYEFVYSEGVENFYKVFVSTERFSGYKDEIPVILSEQLLQFLPPKGKRVNIIGRYFSHNQKNPRRVLLYLFADEVLFIEDDKETFDQDNVFLRGCICKLDKPRHTPYKRKVIDFIVAVRRNAVCSDYISSIAWGRNADYVGNAQVGDQIELIGRIQSRKYTKKTDEGKEERIAYEVSASKVLIGSSKTDSEENVDAG